MTNTVYIATGGSNPGVYELRLGEDNNLSIAPLARSEAGKSVYRLDLLVEEELLARADKKGEIFVYRRDEEGLKERAKFLHYSPREPMVMSVAALSGSLLISSGSDFTLRIYSVESGKLTGRRETGAIAFALKRIDAERFAGIMRDGAGDHLVVWHGGQMREEYRGPAFKIASSYLNVEIDVDTEKGQLIHGDRAGTLHIYRMGEEYDYRSVETGHGNFYGVLFQGPWILTAGELDRRLIQWDRESGEQVSEIELPGKVYWLARMDHEHVIAVVDMTALVCLRIGESPQIISRLSVADIRHVAGMPVATVRRGERALREKVLRNRLAKIRELFESGATEEAYGKIRELEELGYRREALEALSIAEKAQGHLLDELESLLVLLRDVAPSTGTADRYIRVAEILESLYEPEYAIEIYTKLQEAGLAEVRGKIEELEAYRMPREEMPFACAGFRSPELVEAEIRKHEILNRNVESALVYGEEDHNKVGAESRLESIAEVLREEESEVYTIYGVEKRLWKEGWDISRREVLRISATPAELENMECWVELPEELGEKSLKTYSVYVPGESEGREGWNEMHLERFRDIRESERSRKWYGKTVEHVLATLSLAAGEGTENDDEMFT